MKFAAYWANLLAKNCQLADESTVIRLTVGEFKRHQEQAFDANRVTGSSKPPTKQTADEIFRDSLFGKIFGR